MRYLAIIVLSLSMLSCGSAQLRTLNACLAAKCEVIAPLLPPQARAFMTPEQFCATLEAAGEMVAFLAEHKEKNTCPLK